MHLPTSCLCVHKSTAFTWEGRLADVFTSKQKKQISLVLPSSFLSKNCLSYVSLYWEI